MTERIKRQDEERDRGDRSDRVGGRDADPTAADLTARGIRKGFDPRVAGRRAECDGGGLAPGGRYIMREEFTGTLTGEFYEEGEPAWRWYLLAELTRAPRDYRGSAVWCESESLFLIEPPSATSPGPAIPEPSEG